MTQTMPANKSNGTEGVGTAVTSAATRMMDAIKPIMRGWIHLVVAPITLIAGIVLTILTPPGYRWASIVFTISSVILFGMSALYHRGNWSDRTRWILRRLDHSNIFILIAGTYTPLASIILPRDTAILVLLIVWGGAVGGVLIRLLWAKAPRWLFVPIYLALGWVAVWFLPDFWTNGSAAIVWLVIAGGVAYTIGAVVYALKWPNPSPRVFGFHEIFHSWTVVGWICHCVAAYLVVLL